jgi:anti-sigma regulatory factor (Ser/Thr protein kinase)
MSSTPARPQPREDNSALTLVVEQNNSAPALARAAISAFCENRAIPLAVLATVKLLVSEVVTNAVTHPDVEPPANVRLVARLEPDVIRVEVTDDGSGFDPVPHDPSRSGSGFGLFLVDKEAVRWGVDEIGGNRVWFEVALDNDD